jgi:hypothetical protein
LPQNWIPLKSNNYRPQGRRSIERPKKRGREQLQPWRRNGSKSSILDVFYYYNFTIMPTRYKLRS